MIASPLPGFHPFPPHVCFPVDLPAFDKTAKFVFFNRTLLILSYRIIPTCHASSPRTVYGNN
jgi:hypothetical protein